MDENAPNWTFEEYAEGLSHPLAERQFAADLGAYSRPTPASSFYLAAAALIPKRGGWPALGNASLCHPGNGGAELMYKLFDQVVGTLDDLVKYLCYDRDVQ